MRMTVNFKQYYKYFVSGAKKRSRYNPSAGKQIESDDDDDNDPPEVREVREKERRYANNARER